MTVTALIEINQGSGIHTDVAGNAVIGTVTDGTVVFSNGDDTDVVSWTYELVDVPPGSAIALHTQGPSAVSTYTMTQPDVPGSYRVMLTVEDASGDTDIDIRNLCVPFPNGIICPPYQGNPPQRPLTGAGAKPDEMNVGGQDRGWHGDDDLSRPLMYQVLQAVDSGVGALQLRFQLTGEYSSATVPGYFTAPQLVLEGRTIVEVGLVRRTAGTAGTTRCNVYIGSSSIFLNPGDMPQVSFGDGDNATNTTTTFGSTVVFAGDFINVVLEEVETYLAGPPEGPEGLEVLIKLT